MAGFPAKNLGVLGAAARASRAQCALMKRNSDEADPVFTEGPLLSISIAPVMLILGIIALAA